MNSSLQDHQVVIISGASRGIGKAIAEYFIHQKYTVILIARNKDRLEAFANQHSQGNVHYYATDISDFKRMQSIVSEIIKQFGRIDILVNNAGIVKFGTSDISAENFEKMLDINLRAMFHLTNSIVPIMKQQQKGYIFNICSRAAKLPNPGTGAYALTKSGMLAYSHALLRELISFNIKVTALCPGATNTELLNELGSDLDRNNMVSIDDMVKTIDYLLSLGTGVSVPEILLDDLQSPLLNIKKHIHHPSQPHKGKK